ncbi:hypothetical protein SLEP1_g5098 [Rubroshorea leprosula]|uniref:Uncharacterized protein n=1 Tax=Rubroshorea leprosula TaxID=152421 RepID=A0AAV5I1G1_9ROSI|nr:hypothetical protein SLEP1_g5098 [Rubroshorea leprosula]
MGAAGNNKQKNSFFSLASLFKLRGNRARREDTWAAEDTMTAGRRVDEEKRYWPVPEPGIDKRAADFIAQFHNSMQLASS